MSDAAVPVETGGFLQEIPGSRLRLAMLDFGCQPSSSQLRWFGLSVAGLLGILGCLFWWRSSSALLGVLLLSSGMLVALVYYAVPRTQQAIIRGFRLLTLPLQWAVSILLIGVLYYLIVTPIGLGLRICGRDPLAKRLDRRASTYWTAPTTPEDAGTYFRQY